MGAAWTALPCAGWAQGAAGGPIKGPDPVDLRTRLLEHRQEEAQAKARAASLGITTSAATANQAAYDVLYYDLDFDFTVLPASQQLNGLAGVRAMVTGDSITVMELDLDDNLVVTGVTAGGLTTGFAHALDLLTVTLDRTYTTGELVDVVVAYFGSPSNPSFGWDTYAGEDMIWTLSEPYGARTWWPCKDVNTDKADSLDIRITVPSDMMAASQGRLLSNLNLGGGKRLFHWRTDYPTNTYQVSLAIHPYTYFTDTYTPQGGGPTMQVQYYVFPDHYTSVQETYAKTVPMMHVFAQAFGEYPFINEKYGHAEFLGGAGMEHQTISSLGTWDENVIAHELGHQWFGNYVTCADFGHVWLNEGIATWCEAYWREQSEGEAAYFEYMDAAAYYGQGTIFVEDPVDFGAIFNGALSYNKGSWVIHMLRGVLGDADFFTGLRDYLDLYAYGSATTEQFRDVMEAVSGKDLDAFFDQWIYEEYYPCYASEWTQIYSDSGSTLILTINQVQTNTGLFTMPIPVRVVTDSDTLEFKVDNSQASQTYYLPCEGEVLQVDLDPDHWILRRIQNEITEPTFSDGVLLVNGVYWGYAPELIPSYQDSAFTGAKGFDFWDVFDEPQGGYPAELPAPLGHGPVPADVLGRYSTVVWLSESYKGDMTQWFDTSILPFLEVGGNVVLITRRAKSFVDSELQAYMGIEWTNNATTLQDYSADYPGLKDIHLLGTQSWNDLFALDVGPQSKVLFKDASLNRGVGVHAWPAGGGAINPNGGHFVLLSGRPYRMDPVDLRDNMELILTDIFKESPVTGAHDLPVVQGVRLGPGYPNPFATRTVIPLALEKESAVSVDVYDINGRQVRSLYNGRLPAGPQELAWDGRDGFGRPVASGMYYVRLQAAGETRVRSLVRTR